METKDEGNRSAWHQYFPIIFISPFAAPNHFQWHEFTLSGVSLKVFIRQRYKPDTPEVVMEVKRHFLVGQTGPEEVSLIVGGQPLVFRCHADRIVRASSLAACDKSQGNV